MDDDWSIQPTTRELYSILSCKRIEAARNRGHRIPRNTERKKKRKKMAKIFFENGRAVGRRRQQGLKKPGQSAAQRVYSSGVLVSWNAGNYDRELSFRAASLKLENGDKAVRGSDSTSIPARLKKSRRAFQRLVRSSHDSVALFFFFFFLFFLPSTHVDESSTDYFRKNNRRTIALSQRSLVASTTDATEWESVIECRSRDRQSNDDLLSRKKKEKHCVLWSYYEITITSVNESIQFVKNDDFIEKEKKGQTIFDE